MADRILYEFIKNGKPDGFIETSDESKTLNWAKSKGLLSSLSFGRENKIVKNFADIDSKRSFVEKIFVSVYNIESYHFELKLFLQTGTEPDLFANCFTQSQVVEYLEKNQTQLLSNYFQTFIMFDNGKDQILVLVIEPCSTYATIDEIDNPAIWTNDTHRSVLIKNRVKQIYVYSEWHEEGQYRVEAYSREEADNAAMSHYNWGWIDAEFVGVEDIVEDKKD